MKTSNPFPSPDNLVPSTPNAEKSHSGRKGGLATTMRSSHSTGSLGSSVESPLLVYLRRRDGERPLGIVAAFVVLLTLDLDVTAILRTHDWRPVAFYSAFCILAAAAAIILALQWRNENLLIGVQGLLHHDWLRRSTLYSWADVTSAIERRRPGNTRLLLQIRKTRNFVLHEDWPPFPTAVLVCKERLAAIGTDVVED